MRAILGCTLLLSCGSLLADDKKDEKLDAAKLVGKWKLDNGNKEDYDVVYEFTKDGKMSLVWAVLDKERHELKFKGTYTVEGNKVLTKLVGKGTVDPRDWVINKLTDTELHVTEKKDPAHTHLTDTELKFVRVK